MQLPIRLRHLFRDIAPPFGVLAGLSTAIWAGWRFFQTAPQPYVQPGIILALSSLVFAGFAVWQIVRHRKAMQRNGDQYTSLAKELSELTASYQDLRQTYDRQMAMSLQAWQTLESILGLDYKYCIYLRQNAASASVGQIESTFTAYIAELLDKTAKIFVIYTGDKDCAACIKFFSKSPQEAQRVDLDGEAHSDQAQYVFTFARDGQSRHDRDKSYSDLSSIYSYAENTAFYAVKHVKQRKGYFFGNNLSSLSAEEYQNSNPRWRELYNAVAVTALRSPEKDAIYQSLGYLCVDNMQGGFDDQVCREILECVASIAYYSIRITTAILKEKETTVGL